MKTEANSALMSWMRSDETAPIREERPTHSMFYDAQRAKAPLSERAAAASEKLVGIAGRAIHGPVDTAPGVDTICPKNERRV